MILRAPARTSVRTRRYAPKGSRPLRTTVVAREASPIRHDFIARVTDPVSCFWCNLPSANWRHQP